jgi:hypothetical protein
MHVFLSLPFCAYFFTLLCSQYMNNITTQQSWNSELFELLLDIRRNGSDIHLWYSWCMPQHAIFLLRERERECVLSVCEREREREKMMEWTDLLKERKISVCCVFVSCFESRKLPVLSLCLFSLIYLI